MEILESQDEDSMIDKINGAIAGALDVSKDVLIGGCLGGRYCSNGPFLTKRGGQVVEVLRRLQCDPEAVAAEIRQIVPEARGFVITPEGFGPHCVAAGLLTVGVLRVLEVQVNS